MNIMICYIYPNPNGICVSMLIYWTQIPLALCLSVSLVELAWRSGSVMDCHATARGLIPGGNGVFTELHVLR